MPIGLFMISVLSHQARLSGSRLFMMRTYLKDENSLTDQLAKFCSSSLTDETIISTVSEILSDVRQNGDSAVLKRTFLYDCAKLSVDELRVSQKEIECARDQLSASE